MPASFELVFPVLRIIFLLLELGWVCPLMIEKPIEEPFLHVQASFGGAIPKAGLVGMPLVVARPFDGCTPLENACNGTIVLMQRGHCNFTDKVFHAQKAGASAAIVMDSKIYDRWAIIMFGSKDQVEKVIIPSVFVSYATGRAILRLDQRSGPSRNTSAIRLTLNEIGNVRLDMEDRTPWQGVLVYTVNALVLFLCSFMTLVLVLMAVNFYQRTRKMSPINPRADSSLVPYLQGEFEPAKVWL